MSVRPLLVVLACAALVTACGSSGSSGPGTSASTTSAPATVTRTVTTSSPTTSSPTSSSATPSSTTSTTTAASVPTCVASDLALTSLGGSGATGHELLAFGLRDTSSHACRTGGYPGVEFLDGSGGALPTTPDHTTDDFFGHTTLSELTVAPGQSVSFRLGITDVGSTGQTCVQARAVQIIPPNDTATLRISRDVLECGGKVSVSPVQTGTTALR